MCASLLSVLIKSISRRILGNRNENVTNPCCFFLDCSAVREIWPKKLLIIDDQQWISFFICFRNIKRHFKNGSFSLPYFLACLVTLQRSWDTAWIFVLCCKFSWQFIENVLSLREINHGMRESRMSVYSWHSTNVLCATYLQALKISWVSIWFHWLVMN